MILNGFFKTWIYTPKLHAGGLQDKKALFDSQSALEV